MIPFAIDHLWQSTLFAAFIAGLTLAFRTNGAHVRFGLWFAAALKFLLPVPLIVAAGRQLQWANAPTIPAEGPWPDRLGNFIAPSQAMIGDVIAPTAATPMPSFAGIMASDWDYASILWAIWACGTGVVILWQTFQWLRLRAVVAAAAPLTLTAPIKVVSSPALLEPGLIGVFRPILVLPEGIANNLTPQQLDAVLAHELCHWRRRDNLTAAIYLAIAALFWFHPLVWWIGRRLVAERERACDENVLAAGASPQSYAESILAVCRFYIRSPLVCASGMASANLKDRVARVIQNPAVRPLSRLKISILVVLASATLVVPLGVGLLIAEPAIAEAPVALAVDQTAGIAATEPQIAESVPLPEAAVPAALVQRVTAPPPVKPRIAARPPAHQGNVDNDVTKARVEQETVEVSAAPQQWAQTPASGQDIVAQPLPIAALISRGDAAFAKKDYQRAIAEFSEAIALAPNSAEAFLKRGNAHFARGGSHPSQYERAIVDYDIAIQLKPDYAVAYNNRGFALVIAAKSNRPEAYELLPVLDRAIADYDAAIRLKPDFALAYQNRGHAHLLTNSERKGARQRAQDDDSEAARLVLATENTKSLPADVLAGPNYKEAMRRVHRPENPRTLLANPTMTIGSRLGWAG